MWKNADAVFPSSRTVRPWISWLLFAGFGLLYLATAARTVQGGDSGELVTVAAAGGVPHPSGYPLFALLSRLFTLLVPFGSVAWKVAAFSGLLGAAALGVLHRAILRVTRDDFAAFLGASMLGVSPLFWKWSVVQEVLSGACLTAALVLLAAVGAARGAAGPRQGLVVGLAFATGVAHHHTAILLVPLVVHALFVAAERPRSPKTLLRVLGPAALGVSLGFLPYLAFLGDGGAWRWGETGSLGGLVHHFLRADYGTFDTGQPARGVALSAQPLLYLKGLATQFPFLLIALVVLGFRFVFRMRLGRSFGLALIATWLLAGPLFVMRFDLPAEGYYRVVVERFHPFPNVLAAMLAGIGAAGLCRLDLWSTRLLPRAVLLGNLLVAAWLAWPHAVMSGEHIAEDFVTNTLGAVEPRALVLAQGDGFYYGCLEAGEVRGLRPDVACVKPGMLRFPWYRAWLAERHPDLLTEGSEGPFDLPQFVGANLSLRPVYLSLRTPLVQPGLVQHLPPMWPAAGTLLRVARSGQTPPPPSEVEAQLLEAWAGFEVRSRLDHVVQLEESLEYPLWDHYGLAWNTLASGYEAVEDEAGRARSLDCVRRLSPWLVGEETTPGGAGLCPLFAPRPGVQ